MKQTIRIIGGTYRGKKLQFPQIEDLRPTPDRVRETLFNWLMKDVRDARCLDAFAGSGALGLEAFSRGAAKVTFIEQAAPVYANLQNIIGQFATPKLIALKADTLVYLSKLTEQFDIVFLDPPFDADLIPQCLTLIWQNNLIKQGGLVYLESAKTIEIDALKWRQIKLKQAGRVIYGLFEKL